MIVKLNGDITNKMEEMLDNPQTKTFSLGFSGLEPFYKLVLGSTTYIGGIPSHGKSEFQFEIQMQLSERYGFQHIIKSPESGNASEIYLELACKHTKKVARHGAFNRINKDDLYKSIGFIQDHFLVHETEEKPPSPTELLEEIRPIINKKRLTTISIDPWNELSHNFNEFGEGNRQDTYLETALGNIRRFSRKENVHTFVVAHPRTLQKNKDGFYDAPTAFELSGGATWYAKADSIICVYRPFEFSKNVVEQSHVDIIIQKAKPKAVGKKGVWEADFDWQVTGRYRERNPDFEQPTDTAPF